MKISPKSTLPYQPPEKIDKSTFIDIPEEVFKYAIFPYFKYSEPLEKLCYLNKQFYEKMKPLLKDWINDPVNTSNMQLDFKTYETKRPLFWERIAQPIIGTRYFNDRIRWHQRQTAKHLLTELQTDASKLRVSFSSYTLLFGHDGKLSIVSKKSKDKTIIPFSTWIPHFFPVGDNEFVAYGKENFIHYKMSQLKKPDKCKHGLLSYSLWKPPFKKNGKIFAFQESSYVDSLSKSHNGVIYDVKTKQVSTFLIETDEIYNRIFSGAGNALFFINNQTLSCQLYHLYDHDNNCKFVKKGNPFTLLSKVRNIALRRLSFEGHTLFGYTEETKYFLILKNRKTVVYDPNTNEQILEAPTGTFAAYFKDNLAFFVIKTTTSFELQALSIKNQKKWQTLPFYGSKFLDLSLLPDGTLAVATHPIGHGNHSQTHLFGLQRKGIKLLPVNAPPQKKDTNSISGFLRAFVLTSLVASTAYFTFMVYREFKLSPKYLHKSRS